MATIPKRLTSMPAAILALVDQLVAASQLAARATGLQTKPAFDQRDAVKAQLLAIILQHVNEGRTQ